MAGKNHSGRNRQHKKAATPMHEVKATILSPSVNEAIRSEFVEASPSGTDLTDRDDILHHAGFSLEVASVREGRLSYSSDMTDNDKSPILGCDTDNSEKQKKTIEQLRLNLKIVDQDLVQKVSTLNEKDDEIRRLHKELKSCNALLENKSNELSDIHSQIHEIEGHIYMASCELQGKDEPIDFSNAPFEKCSSPSQRHSRRIVMLISVLSGMKAEMKGQANAMARINSLNEQLENDLRTVQSQFAQLGREYKKERNLLNDVTAKLNSSNEVIAKLEAEKEELQSKHAVALERSLEDLEVFRKELADTIVQLNASYAQLEAMEEAHQTEIGELKEEIADAKKAWRSFQNQVNIMKGEMAECSEYSAEMEAARDGLLVELEQLKIDLTEARNGYSDMEVDLENATKEFAVQRSAMQAEIEDLKTNNVGSAELAAVKAEAAQLLAEKTELVSTSSSLRAELDNVKSALRALEESVQASAEQLKGEREQLLADHAANINRLQYERTVLQNEVDGLKSELNEISSINLRNESTLASAQKALTEMESEYHILLEEKENLDKDHAEQLAKVAELQELLYQSEVAHTSRIEELSASLESASTTLALQNQQISENNDLTEELRRELEVIRTKQAKSKMEADVLTEQLISLTTEKEVMVVELNNLRMNERNHVQKEVSSQVMKEIHFESHTEISSAAEVMAEEEKEVVVTSVVEMESISFEAPGPSEELLEALQTIDALRTELSEVQYQLTSTANRLREVEQQNADDQNEHILDLARIRDELKNAQSLHMEAKHEIAATNAERENLRQELAAALQAAVAYQKSAELSDNSSSVAQLESQLREVTVQLASTQHFLSLANYQLISAEAVYHEELEDQRATVEEFKTELIQLRAENDDLQAQMDHYHVLYLESMDERRKEHDLALRRFITMRQI